MKIHQKYNCEYTGTFIIFKSNSGFYMSLLDRKKAKEKIFGVSRYIKHLQWVKNILQGKMSKIIIPGIDIKDIIISRRINMNGVKQLLIVDKNGDLFTFWYHRKTVNPLTRMDIDNRKIEKIFYEDEQIFLVTDTGNLLDYRQLTGWCKYMYIDCGGKMKNLKKILKRHYNKYRCNVDVGKFYRAYYTALLNNGEVYTWIHKYPIQKTCSINSMPIKTNIIDIRYDKYEQCNYILVDRKKEAHWNFDLNIIIVLIMNVLFN